MSQARSASQNNINVAELNRIIDSGQYPSEFMASAMFDKSGGLYQKLADIYLQKMNVSQACFLYELAARAGNTPAFESLKLLVQKGSAAACLVLASLLETGVPDRLAPDIKSAIEYLYQSNDKSAPQRLMLLAENADNDNDKAQAYYTLALIYQTKRCKTKDDSCMLAWCYGQAAHRGHADAKKPLRELAERGNEIAKMALSSEYVKAAMTMKALHETAMFYLEDRKTFLNRQIAIHYFYMAAKIGYRPSFGKLKDLSLLGDRYARLKLAEVYSLPSYQYNNIGFAVYHYNKLIAENQSDGIHGYAMRALSAISITGFCAAAKVAHEGLFLHLMWQYRYPARSAISRAKNPDTLFAVPAASASIPASTSEQTVSRSSRPGFSR